MEEMAVIMEAAAEAEGEMVVIMEAAAVVEKATMNNMKNITAAAAEAVEVTKDSPEATNCDSLPFLLSLVYYWTYRAYVLMLC